MEVLPGGPDKVCDSCVFFCRVIPSFDFCQAPTQCFLLQCTCRQAWVRADWKPVGMGEEKAEVERPEACIPQSVATQPEAMFPRLRSVSVALCEP